MGNMELRWITKNIGDYNLQQAVDLMQQVDWRLSVVNNQVEDCSIEDVPGMLNLLEKQNNLEIAYDIVSEHLDTLLEEELERTFAMLDWIKEI